MPTKDQLWKLPASDPGTVVRKRLLQLKHLWLRPTRVFSRGSTVAFQFNPPNAVQQH